MEVTFRGWIGRSMRRKGWSGFTLPLPFGRSCILYWLEPSDRIRRHERHHAKQIKELGSIRFAWQYLKELRKVGYRANRFEVEAREAE